MIYLSAFILRRHGKIIATVWLKNISYMHNRYILFNYYWIWMHCLRAMQCKHEHFAPWTLCSFLHAFVCFDHYEREGSSNMYMCVQFSTLMKLRRVYLFRFIFLVQFAHTLDEENGGKIRLWHHQNYMEKCCCRQMMKINFTTSSKIVVK